jgi:NADPH:quinone reductase-like Zn-dependent oxidoreductase
MRAIVQYRYGTVDDLRLGDTERPTPADGEVLVRVRAASVHPDVWHVVAGRPYVLRLMGAGVRRPACPVPGTDLAGVVEAVGAGVDRFRPGDEVFGETLRTMAWRHGGAYAEYATAPESALAHKPAGVTFAAAATVPTTGYIALQNLPADRTGPGCRVLVNGAGGGVGAIVVQLAKAGGAHVTGVDHTGKLDLLRTLGADETVDFTRTDVTRLTQRYDLVVDIPGNHPYPAMRRILAPGGVYVLIGHDDFGRAGRRWLGSIPRFGGLMLRSVRDPHLRRDVTMLGKREAMETLRGHLAAGRLTPVIDRTFPLEEAAAALRHLTDGAPLGRIVLTV